MLPDGWKQWINVVQMEANIERLGLIPFVDEVALPSIVLKRIIRRV
jgi:hypothetical protein